MWAALLSAISSNFLYFVLHISNNNSFPKPLNSKEEQECLLKIKEGDKASRTRLIEHNLRLVSHIVKKYYSKTNDTDDLISIGTIGLIKAIDSFNIEKSVRLATYASRCIENELLMHFRSLKKTSQDIYMGDPIDTDKDGNPLSLIDIISDDSNMEEDFELNQLRLKLAECIKKIQDPREKEIIILRYGLNNQKPLTQREVASHLKISRSYVSRIEKKTLEKLRAEFEKSSVNYN